MQQKSSLLPDPVAAKPVISNNAIVLSLIKQNPNCESTEQWSPPPPPLFFFFLNLLLHPPPSLSLCVCVCVSMSVSLSLCLSLSCSLALCLLFSFSLHSGRPDMTFAVDWTWKTNYLSIYLSTLSFFPTLSPLFLSSFLPSSLSPSWISVFSTRTWTCMHLHELGVCFPIQYSVSQQC